MYLHVYVCVYYIYIYIYISICVHRYPRPASRAADGAPIHSTSWP